MPPPTVEQGLAYGFRTPEQAFQSFRTAFQGELLDEEYRSFSQGWRARNGGVSRLDYGEARDRLVEEVPMLRWALYKASEPELLLENERFAFLQSRIPAPLWFADRWLVVRLVRQGYWDVWVEEESAGPLYGDVVDDPVGDNYLYFDERRSPPTLYGIVPLPELAGVRDVDMLVVGWEWKIDDIQVSDDPLDAAALTQ